MYHFNTLPTSAGGGGEGSRSGSVSTHASMEATGSAASHNGPTSSSATPDAHPMQIPEVRRHGLGLLNGDQHSSPASQTSSPLYHQAQTSRQSSYPQQHGHPYPQQSSHQYQHQSFHRSHQHHLHAASISSSAGFRHDSTDSGLTPAFLSNNLLHSSPNLMNDDTDLPSLSGHTSTAISASTDVSSQILIASIVQRLVNKLPCNSGLRLGVVEEDDLVRSCVMHLINLSCFQLGMVVKELLGAIEVLVKQSSQQRLEHQASIGMLHSQLFILKVLVSCLNHQWRIASGHVNRPRPGLDPLPPRRNNAGTTQDHSLDETSNSSLGWSDPPPMDDTQVKHVLSVMTLLIKQNVAREDSNFSSIHEGVESRSSAKSDPAAANATSGRAVPTERSLRDLSLRETASSFSGNKSFGGHSSSRSGRDDAEARDDTGASSLGDKFSEVFMPSSLCLAASTSLYVLYPCFPASRSPFDTPPSIDHMEMASAAAAAAAAAAVAVESPTASPKDKPAATNVSPDAKFNASSWTATAFSADVGGFDVPNHLQTCIYRLASQVVFYLSSSNWVVVNARLRNRLYYLSSTIEEAPSTAELRLLECTNFERTRLASVLHEVGTSFPQLKRSAQYAIALTLRRAIWSWIQYHPEEYAKLATANRRFEGSPDVVFDQVYNLADTTKRKIAFWPMLTSLLVLCPDLVGKAAVGENRKASGSLAKKLSFIDGLRKSPRNTALIDVATLCCVDLFKAAASVPSSENGLRLIVHDLEAELKGRLFDPKRPLASGNKTIELMLTTDLFAALFRLSPERTIRELVPVCMAESSPIHFKIALVKACVLLTSERHRLPWAPDVSLLYPHISRPLRAFFRDTAHRLPRFDNRELARKHAQSRSASSSHFRHVSLSGSAAAAASSIEELGRLELLQSIMQLWTLDVAALAHGIDLDQPESLASLSGGSTTFDREMMFRTAVPIDSLLSFTAAVCTLVCTPPEFATHRRSCAVLLGRVYHSGLLDDRFTELCDHMRNVALSCLPFFFTILTEQLLATDDPEMQLHFLDLLRRSQQRRGFFISQVKDWKATAQAPFYPPERERKLEYTWVQLAILLMLCSSDTEVCSLAMQCAREHAQLTIAISDYYDPLSDEWLRLYTDLADPSFLHTGRIAQQKRIRALLRDVETPSAASWLAWKKAYLRWSSLTQLVVRPIAENTLTAQDKAAQWHNYAGFLCAFGGACFSASDTISSEIEPSIAKALPRFSSLDEPPSVLVERFVQEMVDLLVSESLWVREKAKETLGVDLGPRLISILFRQIHAVLSDFFDKQTGYPKTSDMYTVFVEQSIGVATMVLNRLDETKAASATSKVDIGSLMVLFVEYANSLRRDEQALRIKAAMCQMCEALMRKKAAFSFSNELRVRNRLFQALTTWTSDGTEDGYHPNGLDAHERLQRDLDVACLKCISILLDKLPLLLADDALLLDDKVEGAKTRHFAMHFGYFIKILNRTRHLETAAAMRTRALTDAKSLAGNRASKGDSARDYAPLRESAILALSNLLASNIDSGLHNSLPLAYHEDPRLRTAFMQIMTNVLNQGTAFDELERMSGARESTRLVDLVCQGNLQLALAICQVCPGRDVESMSVLLLSMFDARGGLIRFLKAAVEEEIQRTATEEMVFRSNSFCTTLLSTFAKTHGYDYLRSIMAPLITEFARKPVGFSVEMDPSRVDPGGSVFDNQIALEEIAQTFIEAICSSAHRVPAVLRELCRHIRDVLDARFPASRYQGVGGLMFLRFISPAVVSPHMIDINLTGPSKDLRRGLVLISKILITLASNNLFSSHKEPFMTGLNDFLKSNVWKVTAFLDQVSDARTDPDRVYAADQPLGYGIHPGVYGIDERDQRTLHKFLFENVDKLGKNLADRASPAADDVTAFHNGEAQERRSDQAKRVYDELCDALAAAGEPKGDELSEPSFGARNFQDFLRRHAGRNIDEESYRSIFYEGPSSRGGRPVLYYTLHKQKADTIDFEGLILYILQTLEPFAYRQFDIVIDTTACQPSNATPSQWLLYFSSLVPASILASVVNILFINPNTMASVELQFWNTSTYNDSTLKHEVADRMTSLQNVVYCSALFEIDTWIERSNLALDQLTMSILSSPIEVHFDQITSVWYYRNLTPVTFSIGGEFLQITGLKPQDWLPNHPVQLNDVFHLSDIDDVRSISIRGDDNTFFLSCRNGSMNFVFNSRERSEVVQALRQAKARATKSRADNAVDRVLRPNDVPGTLLNMAMHNITSNDSALRLSAYNLLCALSTSFNFGASSAKKRLLSSRGLALPANTMAFVTDLSKDFAVAAPGVTLEFLLSFFDGFERASPSQKTVCLHYLSPWLSNLVMFVHTSRDQQSEYHRRIKEILGHLISITTKQPDMYAIMQRCVWSQLSRLDDLIPTFLDVFAEAAMDSGLHTERFEAVLDTMVSFASINMRGKLLSRLRKVVARTAQNPVVSQLHLNASWKEIATLVRMNMVLSFTNRVEALLYLPELLHVILLLSGNGVDATRHSIYGSAINLVHSLCTEDPREARKPEEATPRSAEAVDKLRVLLDQLAQPESLKLFGLPVASQSSQVNAAFAAGSQDTVRDPPDNASIERLATLMYEVADAAAPNTDAANSWRARLASLVTSTAFQYNPIIQARAFVLLGCLAQGEIDDDLLYQILVSLRGSFSEWASSNADTTMISIVTCLSKVVKILPSRSRYLPQMFWLGIAMVQCGHIPLFKAGVELMHSTVETIWERGIPLGEGDDLISHLLDARFEFRDLACKLDDETGVDFDINFSFGMAALLVKGLRHPSTKEVTTKLMQAMLHHCGVDGHGELRSKSGRISERQLGFFVGLLPTATRPEEFGQLLALAGVDSSICQAAVEARRSGYKGLQEYLDVLNNRIALLLVTLVTSLLQHAESDAERLMLYGFLNEAAREVPAIVSILYDSLAPSMKDIFVNCSNGAILDAVHGIAQTAVSQPFFAAQARETAKRGGPNAYLVESGYGSLLGCGAFVPLMEGRRHVLCKLSIQLLLGLTDVGTT